MQYSGRTDRGCRDRPSPSLDARREVPDRSGKFADAAAILSTARRHGISRSLLSIWRRSFEADAIETELAKPAFIPAMLVNETAPPARGTPASGRMVIEIGEHRRVIVDAGVDAKARAWVLDVLGRQ